MRIGWTKKGEHWGADVGPFRVAVQPKGDGRWTWEVFADGASNPMARGVAASLGSAKTVVEQLVTRSGRVS